MSSFYILYPAEYILSVLLTLNVIPTIKKSDKI